MSSRGILSNKLYVDVSISFQDVWDDLDNNEQEKLILDNISMVSDNDLIGELESRGFNITKEE